MNPQLVTLAEAAQLSGYSIDTLRRRIKSGALPAYRLTEGRSIRLKRADVDALLVRETSRGPAPDAIAASVALVLDARAALTHEQRRQLVEALRPHIAPGSDT